jgi:hypothetical protein
MERTKKKKNKSTKNKKIGNFAENLQREGLLNLYLVALFSADSLQDKEDCERSLKHLEELKSETEKSKLENKDYYLDMIEKGKDIVMKEMENMK